MLVSQIIESGFPHLSMFDKVVFALDLMEDYDVLHLPVIVEEKFAGIISKDDLMDSDETAMLASACNLNLFMPQYYRMNIF